MSRLCVGCGLCLGICPVNAINLKTGKGVVTVNFDYSKCTNCGACIKVCPALFNLYSTGFKFPYNIGETNGVFFSYSTNKDIRYCGASGGVITSLLLFMLDHKIVDEVLVVRMEGLSAHPLLTSNKDDVLSAQGSIYFKTFSLQLLPKIINSVKKGNKLCIVGLPCQISALKRALHRFKDKLCFISLLCNHVNERWYMEYILEKYLPKNAKALTISARKNGWPGGIKVLFTSKNQQNPQELTISYNTQFWSLMPALNLSAPLGCLMCTDHFASEADIVAADAWHPQFVGKDSVGVSMLLTHTEKGLEIVNSSVKDGVLYVEEARLQDLLIAQAHSVIEGSQYAPFKQKLFQHQVAALCELKEIDKATIATLIMLNRCVLKCKTLRHLLDTSVAKRILRLTLWFLARFESIRFAEAVGTEKRIN